MAFAEYRVCLLSDTGAPGAPFLLRADVDDPAIGDKLWINDEWHEVVDVAHVPDPDARTSPRTTFAQIFCRRLPSPPQYLLDLAGNRVRAPSARNVVQLKRGDGAGPTFGPLKVLHGLSSERADSPSLKTHEKRVVSTDAHSSTTVERSISLMRTFEYQRDDENGALPVHVNPERGAAQRGISTRTTQRVFVVDPRTEKPTLRLLAAPARAQDTTRPLTQRSPRNRRGIATVASLAVSGAAAIILVAMHCHSKPPHLASAAASRITPSRSPASSSKSLLQPTQLATKPAPTHSRAVLADRRPLPIARSQKPVRPLAAAVVRERVATANTTVPSDDHQSSASIPLSDPEHLIDSMDALTTEKEATPR